MVDVEQLTDLVGIPKFAYVRYLDDNVKTIVKISEIKRFSPKSITDFVSDKVYLVRWAADDVGDEHDEGTSFFYKAQILKLGITMGQLKTAIAQPQSRIRVPKILDSAVSTGTEETESEDDCAPRAKRQKKRPTRPAITSQPEPPIPPLPRSPNDENIIKSLNAVKKELEASTILVSQLKRRLGEAKAESASYKNLNVRLQQQLLDKLEKETCKKRPVAPPPPPHQGGDLILESNNDQVNIGAGVWLQKNKWQAIVSQTKHSMFVKNMLVAIWGTSHLQGKSLFGKVCPRYKGDREAKPPLTPEKVNAMRERFRDRVCASASDKQEQDKEMEKFTHYITEKLQDINRNKKN